MSAKYFLEYIGKFPEILIFTVCPFLSNNVSKIVFTFEISEIFYLTSSHSLSKVPVPEKIIFLAGKSLGTTKTPFSQDLSTGNCGYLNPS